MAVCAGNETKYTNMTMAPDVTIRTPPFPYYLLTEPCPIHSFIRRIGLTGPTSTRTQPLTMRNKNNKTKDT